MKMIRILAVPVSPKVPTGSQALRAPRACWSWCRRLTGDLGAFQPDCVATVESCASLRVLTIDYSVGVFGGVGSFEHDFQAEVDELLFGVRALDEVDVRHGHLSWWSW